MLRSLKVANNIRDQGKNIHIFIMGDWVCIFARIAEAHKQSPNFLKIIKGFMSLGCVLNYPLTLEKIKYNHHCSLILWIFWYFNQFGQITIKKETSEIEVVYSISEYNRIVYLTTLLYYKVIQIWKHYWMFIIWLCHGILTNDWVTIMTIVTTQREFYQIR